VNALLGIGLGPRWDKKFGAFGGVFTPRDNIFARLRWFGRGSRTLGEPRRATVLKINAPTNAEIAFWDESSAMTRENDRGEAVLLADA